MFVFWTLSQCCSVVRIFSEDELSWSLFFIHFIVLFLAKVNLAYLPYGFKHWVSAGRLLKSFFGDGLNWCSVWVLSFESTLTAVKIIFFLEMNLNVRLFEFYALSKCWSGHKLDYSTVLSTESPRRWTWVIVRLYSKYWISVGRLLNFFVGCLFGWSSVNFLSTKSALTTQTISQVHRRKRILTTYEPRWRCSLKN